MQSTAQTPCVCTRCSSVTLKRLRRGVPPASRVAVASLERYWNLQDILCDETGIREDVEVSFHKTIKKVGEEH